MIEVKVPDIGDFTDVPVIEILVEVGQEIAEEDPLVTLESDKATMDVPAPQAGVVRELRVALGDKVSEGTTILVLEPASADGGPPATVTGEAPPAPEPVEHGDIHAQVVVLGAGPGGYTAAFRAADLGLKTVLVERYEKLGGVCLNVGCIPSKALLHVARVIAEAEESASFGVRFGEPAVDLDALRAWKTSVVDRLTDGLAGLARRRKVEVVQGEGRFTGPHTLQVGDTSISFDHAIIAVGSSAAKLPGLDGMDSTDALEIERIPERLLVVGGGIIGLEMASVFDALGSRVTVVELMDQLIPGCDPDLVKVLHKRIEGRYEAIHLGTSFDAVDTSAFDGILVAVGRVPNGGRIGAENAGVNVDERGFIAADEQLRTNVAHIHAIGDVIGEPMLAHKATHEGKVAAEVIAGHDVVFDARSIPSVAYTDPEVAWTGLTETQAKADGTPYEKATFPWAASGRALGLGRPDGLTKLLVDPETRRVLGAGMVGVSAGDLVAEVVHAIEMGAVAEDIALSIHPHPTLSETVAFAAETAEGIITDLYAPKREKARA
ncbi:MAG TPA: dihydrolipoyl dehydrogenase [Solirubrobacteraceae bacterium]